MKKCDCISAPQYHREDCSIYDIYGNNKLNIIDYQKVNIYKKINYLEKKYNKIVIAKIGMFYEILFDKTNIKLKKQLELALEIKSSLKFNQENKKKNSPLMIGFPASVKEKYFNKLKNTNIDFIELDRVIDDKIRVDIVKDHKAQILEKIQIL